MSIQQNCHVPVCCASESSVSHSDENMSCQERVESVCGQAKSIRILEEFRRIYEERLRKIDEETSGEGMELKLKTLTSWVNDLGEQNLMLVETVEQLEREAAGRVTLLEERLKKSSHIALEYMSKLEEYDNQFLDLSEGKIEPGVLPIKTSNRLVQAQQTEEILKTRISNLQNDISGLLELIRRARFEASWDINGLSFLEVTYEDIFGSYPHQVNDNLETVSHMQATINMLHQQLSKPVEDYHAKDQEIKMLQEQVACQQADIAFKDIQIKNFLEKMHELQSSSCDKRKEVTLQTENPAIDTVVMENVNIPILEQKQETSSLKQRTVGSGTEEMEISVLNNKLEDINIQLQATLEENERLVKEKEFLSSDLKNKTDIIAALTQHLTEVDKTLKQTRESVNADAAEKHEQLNTLRHNVLRLEKHILQADVQTRFKDAIIKEMRKDVRITQSKLSSQTSSQTTCKHRKENEMSSESKGAISILLPCSCQPLENNKLHILFHHSDQGSLRCGPSTCDTARDRNRLPPTYAVDKGMVQKHSTSHHQMSRLRLQSEHSSPNTSSKQRQDNKKLRERARMKTVSDRYVPKERRNPLDGSLCTKYLEVGYPVPVDFKSAGDVKLNRIKNKVTDKIKQK